MSLFDSGSELIGRMKSKVKGVIRPPTSGFKTMPVPGVFKELQEAGHFNSVREHADEVPVLSAPKLALRRITFKSADGTPLTAGTTWQFRLASPIYNVVYIDWALIDNIQNTCLLRIDEIPSNGITSSGQGYFTSLIGGSTTNLLIQPQPTVKFNPISVSQLTMTLMSGASPLVQVNPWSIELYFYTEE
jgi:hypothetical protein